MVLFWAFILVLMIIVVFIEGVYVLFLLKKIKNNFQSVEISLMNYLKLIDPKGDDKP